MVVMIMQMITQMFSKEMNQSAEEEEKQKEYMTQVTEESPMTQNQHIEETNNNQNQKDSAYEAAQQIRHEGIPNRASVDILDKVQGQTLSAGSESERTPAYTTENKNQASEADQHQRLKEQKQKEEDQKMQETKETNNDETLKQEEQHSEQENKAIESTQQSEAATFDQASKQTTQNNKNQYKSNQGGSNLSESNLNQNSPSYISMEKQERNTESNPVESFSGIPKESKRVQEDMVNSTDQSENQKERSQDGSDGSIYGYTWQICNVTADPDYIPCLDNDKAISQLHSRKHFEHRKRHCPEEGPTCLVATLEGYQRPIEWPTSRDKIQYHNVPHTKLAEVKGHQNWVKVTGEFLTFPGGGTEFIHGALHYTDFIQELPKNHNQMQLIQNTSNISRDGFSKTTLSKHESRGILKVVGYFWNLTVYSDLGAILCGQQPVYQTLEEDVQIWKEMSALTESMCWELVTIKKDQLNSIGAAIYRKPTSNDCYDQRNNKNPPMCKNDDDPDAAWYIFSFLYVKTAVMESFCEIPLLHNKIVHLINQNLMKIAKSMYLCNHACTISPLLKVREEPDGQKLGINIFQHRHTGETDPRWESMGNQHQVILRFAAALKDLKIWVMNVVNTDSPDTLPMIYERGLFRIYRDWCESFSTYPQTYDLLHADHLFSRLRKRCKIAPVMAEIDRIVTAGGKPIACDKSKSIREVENILKSLHWEVHLTFSKDQEEILSAQKSD
ncbi:putative S-adenosyl-L-methionine-dependent methyltransferase [Dillenia turbinata]|uniref:Methyltransferase n=1 Tax=Dillenia turbinata TaxID=194707 RepID=A0AAN8Z4G0_9MAGN